MQWLFAGGLLAGALTGEDLAGGALLTGGRVGVGHFLPAHGFLRLRTVAKEPAVTTSPPPAASSSSEESE